MTQSRTHRSAPCVYGSAAAAGYGGMWLVWPHAAIVAAVVDISLTATGPDGRRHGALRSRPHQRPCFPPAAVGNQSDGVSGPGPPTVVMVRKIVVERLVGPNPGAGAGPGGWESCLTRPARRADRGR
jgi:hypothetical protein